MMQIKSPNILGESDIKSKHINPPESVKKNYKLTEIDQPSHVVTIQFMAHKLIMCLFCDKFDSIFSDRKHASLTKVQ